MRGHSSIAKRQYDRATTDFDEAIRLNPKNAIALFGRGTAYHCKGHCDRALADYDEAIRLDPNFTLAINNRAEIIPSAGLGGRAH